MWIDKVHLNLSILYKIYNQKYVILYKMNFVKHTKYIYFFNFYKKFKTELYNTV